MERNNLIGSRLREFGSVRFTSLKEFAEALEMQPSNLQAYLKGEREPGAQVLKKLRNLGCDINWLLGDEPAPNASSDGVFILRLPEYRLDAMIPAGSGELVDLTEWIRSETLEFDPAGHALLQIDTEFGYSMTPVIQPGDYVMYSYHAKVYDGDIVAARWDATKGAVKIASFVQGNPSLVALISSNPSVPPIVLERSRLVMYKVVMLIKKRR